jgi:hypothetical protein
MSENGVLATRSEDDGRFRAAASKVVMRSERHFAQFTVVEGDDMLFGLHCCLLLERHSSSSLRVLRVLLYARESVRRGCATRERESERYYDGVLSCAARSDDKSRIIR